MVTWARPNPPVGALGDKWRPATSDVVVACVSGKRYWDDLATRKAHATNSLRVGGPKTVNGVPNVTAPDVVASPSGAPLLDYWEIPLLDGDEEKRYGPKEKGMPYRIPNGPKAATPADPEFHHRGTYGFTERVDHNEAGSPLLDYWVIPPGGYEGSHYAVFPPELVVPLVKAMTPEKVCRECGEPSRRIVEQTEEYAAYRERANTSAYPPSKYDAVGNRAQGMIGTAKRDGGDAGARGDKFIDGGWTDCGHNNYRPGLVLDCFGGSGTVGLVATGHGHDCVLIDLDERNYELALQRIGPFMLEPAVYVT